MLYLRLAHGGGVIEVPDAVDAVLDDSHLVLRAADGHVVCRAQRLDVLAYSARLDQLEDSSSGNGERGG